MIVLPRNLNWEAYGKQWPTGPFATRLAVLAIPAETQREWCTAQTHQPVSGFEPLMFGVEAPSHRTLIQVQEILQGLPGLNLPTLGLSALVASSILLGHRFAPRLPVVLFAVVGMIAASARFHFAERGIAVIGPVPGGLPSIKLPDVSWDETLALLPVAASCFVMIIAQSAATSRVYAVRHHERVDEDADILGLAAANAAAAVSGTFVVNGSPTQTAMADSAGARSQVAQLVFAGIVLLVLLFLTGPLQYLPRCVLASIVFTIAVGMVDVKGGADDVQPRRDQVRVRWRGPSHH
jgi:sulfate permease, SulP family